MGGVVALTVLAALSASWLASRSYFSGADARVPVIALAPVAASALIGVCLGSKDVELDRSTPHPWPARRTTEVLAWTVLTSAGLAATVAADPTVFGSMAMVRNVIGYIGLACLTTTVLGAALSWLPGFLISGTLYLAAPRPPTGLAKLWAWPMTPGEFDTSWITPLLLFLAGLTLYAHLGPRSIPAEDT